MVLLFLVSPNLLSEFAGTPIPWLLGGYFQYWPTDQTCYVIEKMAHPTGLEPVISAFEDLGLACSCPSIN